MLSIGKWLTDVSEVRFGFTVRVSHSCLLDPEDEGAKIFRNVDNCLLADGVTSQKTSVFNIFDMRASDNAWTVLFSCCSKAASVRSFGLSSGP